MTSGPVARLAAEKRYGFELADAIEAIQRGEAREALSYYERQAAELEQRGLGLEAAKAHGAVVYVAQRLGQYQKAIRAGLRALELLKPERQTDETLAKQLSLYSHVGLSYRGVGDLKEARRYLEEGLELTKGLGHENRRVLFSGVFWSHLAWLANSSRDYPQAVAHGTNAVQAFERFLDQLPRSPRFDRSRAAGRRHLASSLTRLGNAQRQLGRLEEAETTLRRAAHFSRLAGQKQEEASAVAALGWLALAHKDYVQALARYQEALALATQLNSVPQLITIQDGIGRSYAAQGRYDEALAAYRRSIELVEDVRGQLQEAELRSGFLEDKQAIYHGAVLSAVALGKVDEAFSYAERGRARAFLDLLGNQATLSKGKTRALVEEEVRLRARLSEARALAQDEAGEGDPAQARQQVEAAERAYRAFLERVRKENLEQASLMTVEPVTLREVQSQLPEGTTLLEYLVMGPESLVWVIDRSGAEVVRLPVPKPALVRQVRALRRAIAEQAPLERVQELSTTLYERLIAEARPRIRGDRLLVVPHDVLHYLPFGALRAPGRRWLVEEYTLATLPSASVLKYLRGKGDEASAQALAVGNPDLGPALNLRYAEREARMVGERYPGAAVLVKQEATEARVKQLSGSAGLLHFATHGELNEQDPLSSALLLVPEGQEDGRLEVRELFGLELKARLVVLSACETGLGKLSQGDELVGLQRAFLYAGTPAVVTTLWKVDDRASYVLMREFYAQLAARGPAEALREAQRAAMKEFPHPFAWAAFGLTGMPR